VQKVYSISNNRVNPTIKKLVPGLLFGIGLFAQSWSGIIDPTRATDWSGAGVVGGIPVRNTQCGSTIAAYNGTDATITNALAACAGTNQYVLLGAGTFNLTSGITFRASAFPFSVNGVTLRGMGADQTKLVFKSGNTCGGEPGDICILVTFPLNPFI
jgi:hypothetical protein